jgi:hypothetical protein
MAAIKDLALNPVALTVADGPERHTISAERGPAGKVWLSCDCSASASDGWCRHRIDLLCVRYDAVEIGDAPARHAFERIVYGTRLATAGQDADRALRTFDACLKRFDDGRPERIHGPRLALFTDLVSDLAACAAELEDALSAMKRLLQQN